MNCDYEDFLELNRFINKILLDIDFDYMGVLFDHFEDDEKLEGDYFYMLATGVMISMLIDSMDFSDCISESEEVGLLVDKMNDFSFSSKLYAMLMDFINYADSKVVNFNKGYFCRYMDSIRKYIKRLWKYYKDNVIDYVEQGKFGDSLCTQ